MTEATRACFLGGMPLPVRGAVVVTKEEEEEEEEPNMLPVADAPPPPLPTPAWAAAACVAGWLGRTEEAVFFLLVLEEGRR